MRGWESDVDATLDLTIAAACGIPIMSTYDGREITPSIQLDSASAMEDGEIAFGEDEKSEDLDESILDEAKRITSGIRQFDYGHPSDDFGRTAKLWSAVLGIDVTPAQAIICMICVKLSREVHKPKRDSRVDIAGYAFCLDEVNKHSEVTKTCSIEST